MENLECSCQYDKEMTQLPFLLRGLCPTSFLRTVDQERGLRYILRQKPHNPDIFFLVGGMTTKIDYHDDHNLWKLSDATSEVSATSLARKDTYVIGKHNWTIAHDHKWCREQEGGSSVYKTELKLTACKTGEFTCNDGQCIKMEERCDQIQNCHQDGSDEDECQLMSLMKGYNKNVPPFSFDNEILTPVNVNVSLKLLMVVDIGEVENSIELQFEIILEWTDGRITFNNLKNKTYLNALTDSDMSQVWLPVVVYENTNQRETSRLGNSWEWSTSVTVAREGSFQR